MPTEPGPARDVPSNGISERLWIGTAGWVVPGAVTELFPGDGSHLARYATRLRAAEINSSFHRPHRRTTYERWAASVPAGFRFAVKLPKTISHAPAPGGHDPLIGRFAEEADGLGDKLGVLLVQFPPKRQFDVAEAETLFAGLAASFACPIACEPRHASWFADGVDTFLAERRIARVAADPARIPSAGEPGGWSGLRYYRLHGSPVIYRSSYDDAALARIGDALLNEAGAGAEAWCIFDNTASSAAAGNALSLLARCAGERTASAT